MANPIDGGTGGSAPPADPGADTVQSDGQTGRHGESEADNRQFVTFTVRGETFAVPLAEAQEIIRLPDMVQVPMSPRSLEGLANLRGTVLPVIDQRRRFGLPDTARNDRQRIMVFTINGVRTGFIVDSVSEVLKIARSVIGRAPELSAEQSSLITRVANIERQKRIILLLDVDQLLDKKELGALVVAA